MLESGAVKQYGDDTFYSAFCCQVTSPNPDFPEIVLVMPKEKDASLPSAVFLSLWSGQVDMKPSLAPFLLLQAARALCVGKRRSHCPRNEHHMSSIRLQRELHTTKEDQSCCGGS